MADIKISADTDLATVSDPLPLTAIVPLVYNLVNYKGTLSDFPFMQYVNGGAQFSLPMLSNASGQETSATNITSSADGNDLYVPGTLRNKVLTETVTAANVITIAESNTTFYLDLAAGFASTLPLASVSDGVKLRFVVKTAPSGGSYTIVTELSNNTIQGLVTVNGAMVQASNEDTITFVDSLASVGDWIELESDGVSWYVSGQGFASGAITFTAT